MGSRPKAQSTIIKELEAKVKELEGKVKSAEDTKTMYYKSNQDLEAELAGIHAALDSLPFAPPRKVQDPEYNSYSNKLSVSNRLFVWFASSQIKQKSPKEKDEE